jgi:hypothetical protein
MPRRLPALAIILGVAGIIPFLICGIGATAANDVRSTLAAFALVGYGAVILGFLGGVHWGFTLSVEHDPAERLRLGFGVLPAIIGWLALGISLVTVHPVLGVAILIAAYIGTIVAEWRAHTKGLVPDGYIGLRVGISAVVILLLTTVLGVRLIGAHLIF